ncbi:hypothetical protein COV93_07060 [Candidatus Woesearchaeota archaeon CG11_big_fil_rev_8_21_14_0_20_43_8]|nr:MAG: hypothetical protein COV93_07060 [Candidatus Woesearchaeota archaeon CG11_big_fil_rev_8_21_14_0_20_43_8]PIO05370.1 MAG: hypothetical protein COT47_05100 [Candidatus Woesearchaeota archaeon CG08_land_8_20_14_0_20_43_7]
MLIEPILGYKSSLRVLSLLFETPRRLVSRKDLFEFTKLGNAPLSKALSRLVKAQMIFLEKKGKKEFYRVNLDNHYSMLIKKAWENERMSVRQLDYDIKIIVSEFIRQILDVSEVKRIILFGSWAKGTASINSDIDLALIYKNETTSEIETTRIVKRLEKQFGKEIQVHYMSERSLDSKNKLALEINSDGIDLL